MKVKSIRKFSAYAGSALLAVTLLVLLFALKPDSTVDFRGIVKSVEYNSRKNAPILRLICFMMRIQA